MGRSSPPTLPTGEQPSPSHPLQCLDNANRSHHGSLQRRAEIYSLQHLVGQRVTHSAQRSNYSFSLTGRCVEVRPTSPWTPIFHAPGDNVIFLLLCTADQHKEPPLQVITNWQLCAASKEAEAAFLRHGLCI